MINYSFKLADEIYVYKNFLSEQECENICEFLESLDESDWIFDRPESIHYKRTDPLNLISDVREKMLTLIPQDLFLGKANCAVRMTKGASWGEHCDVHDFDEIEKLSRLYRPGMAYQEKTLSVYGTVVYFNNFEGGEIYYPQHDIIYSPGKGDLVIHSSSNKYIHGVKPVLSEKRYSYSNHIYKMIRIPENGS